MHSAAFPFVTVKVTLTELPPSLLSMPLQSAGPVPVVPQLMLLIVVSGGGSEAEAPGRPQNRKMETAAQRTIVKRCIRDDLLVPRRRPLRRCGGFLLELVVPLGDGLRRLIARLLLGR